MATAASLSRMTSVSAPVIATASDNPQVLFTAFAGSGYTLHAVNSGAARKVTIRGAPGALP